MIKCPHPRQIDQEKHDSRYQQLAQYIIPHNLYLTIVKPPNICTIHKNFLHQRQSPHRIYASIRHFLKPPNSPLFVRTRTQNPRSPISHNPISPNTFHLKYEDVIAHDHLRGRHSAEAHGFDEVAQITCIIVSSVLHDPKRYRPLENCSQYE